MLAARMIQTFDFSDFSIPEKLSFQDHDFQILKPAMGQRLDIIDLDGQVKSIIHPGNKSDKGVPGMTASNMPVHDFACKLTPRA